MSIGNFHIRRACTVPWLEVQITRNGLVPLFTQQAPEGCAKQAVDPNAVDLTRARVTVEIAKCGRVPQTVAPAGTVEILDATNGLVRYKWAPTDLQFAGYYYCTFVVTFRDNTVMRWPFQREALTVEVE